MKKLLIVLFLLTGCVFAQYQSDVDHYQVTFWQVDESQVTELTYETELTEGDTARLEWDYIEPDSADFTWLPYSGDPIFLEIPNSTSLWTDSTATYATEIDLNPGYWQIRMKAIGTNGLESEYSDRAVFKLNARAPARIYIRIK